MSRIVKSVGSPASASKHAKFDAASADRIVAEVDAAVAAGRGEISYPRKGRPSLTGRHKASPTVGFRVTPDLRDRAQAIADKQGLSVSALARQALEDYVRQAS